MTELQTTETPSVPAYSTKQITLATMVGGPLAGFWLLALNYRVFQQPRNALFSIVAGILGTIAVVAIAFFLPPWVPNIVLPVAYTLGMRGLADALQAPSSTNTLATAAELGRGGWLWEFPLFASPSWSGWSLPWSRFSWMHCLAKRPAAESRAA